MATAVGLSGGSSLHGVTDNQKRWLVFGIALSKVLVAQIRPFVEQEVQKEYGKLQTSHRIHTQSTSGRLKNWPTLLKYENINGNDAHPRLPGGRYNYSLFDCRVTSNVDFAKLYVENHMAKFNVFDEHCDASAVLALLGKVPVFSHTVQSAAGDVRQARNAWAHCVFSDWDPVNYQQSFDEMEKLVKALGLLPAFERTLLGELKDWETKGTMLCMNATMDPVVLKLVQQHVNALKTDVEQLTFDVQEDKDRLSQTLKDISTSLEELDARVVSVQRKQEVMRQEQSFLSRTVDAFSIEIDTRVVSVRREQEVIKQEQSSLSNKVYALQTEIDTSVVSMQCEQDIMKQEQSSLTKKVDSLKIQHDTTQVQLKSLEFQQEDVQQRVAHVEEQLSSVIENREDCSYKDPANVISQQHKANVSVEIASFEADIAFFAKRHDSDTRQWFFDDFDAWFHDPGDSRAYVLLGDPGIGKSVMAGVLAQRMRRTGHLGAAYFCRHNDGTRNDPRYLLGTVACQLCGINSQYNTIVGGEGGVRNLLGNSKLRIQELFTKLLQEPLAKCNPNQQRKLVIIDALDETEYESREDFLDLIMHRFPLLPEWLVFFITSRPEDSVQFRLKKYNPCVKICAGNSDQHNFYQQHEQDIHTFLKKRIDFSRLSCTVEDISRKCHGLFLYAHYIVEELKLSVDSGKKLNQLSDLFPGDIDDFFLQNFKRVYDQVGQDLFKKLFGCAVVAPSPLPVSIISYILKKENSSHDEQQVMDAVSQFVVLRTPDQTLTFLHNLIPAWLTDKKKARKLFIDKKIAGRYLRKMFAEILTSVVNESPPTYPSIDVDLEDYVLRVALRFLCQYGERDSLKVVFRCLTSCFFIERRMLGGKIEIYHLLEDFKIAGGYLSAKEKKKQEILQEIFLALESNVLVLLECPHLLHSCIRKASNAVRETILMPKVTAAWLEWNIYDFPDTEIISDMHCFAISPDKKTVAGAKGRSILFFDPSTAETLSGPFEVGKEVIDNINQLEFSSYGKFLFFGLRDKWFSVEKERVTCYRAFDVSENSVYEWVSFTPDGKCIVVKSETNKLLTGSCKDGSCLANFLALWALKEIAQSKGRKSSCSFRPKLPTLLECLRMKTKWGKETIRLLKRFGIETNWDCTGGTRTSYDPFNCDSCLKLRDFDQYSSLATIRKGIVQMYPKLFRYQVYDLNTATWKPVLASIFSYDVQLNPFTYLCHMTCAFGSWGFQMGCSGIDKAMSVCNIAVVNAVHCALLGDNVFRQGHLVLNWEFNEAFRSGFFRNVPIGFQRLDIHKENLVCVSPKRKWAVEAGGFQKIHLFQTERICNNGKPEHNVSKISSFTFTNDDLYFVYSSEGSLHALSLQTGAVFTSVSGHELFYFTEENQLGYLFRNVSGEAAIFLSNLFSPWKFLQVSRGKGKSIATIFKSRDTILSVGSDSMAMLWQTADETKGIAVVSGSPLTRSCPHVIPGENHVLSPDGKLIVFRQGTKVKVHSFAECKTEEFLYTTAFEATAKCYFTIVCSTFSTDSTLLLFCIQDNSNFPYFCVWDVQQNVMTASLKSLGLLSIECCCFSSDKRHVILCGDYVIEIWEYTKGTCQRLGIERPYNSVKFSLCTVSLDNQLLVCCIANRILIYDLFGPDINSSKRVLRGHLGKIEFCRFLKVNRYLISYGVDGMVFLWDINELKAVAFARLTNGEERIANMVVSPEEDRAVCFTSSNRVCMVKLCELGSAMSLKPLTATVAGKVETAETSLPLLEQTTSASQIATSSSEDDMAESLSSSDSEEDMYDYYLEHDILDESD